MILIEFFPQETMCKTKSFVPVKNPVAMVVVLASAVSFVVARLEGISRNSEWIHRDMRSEIQLP
jgi:hypothetical protein